MTSTEHLCGHIEEHRTVFPGKIYFGRDKKTFLASEPPWNGNHFSSYSNFEVGR